MKNIHLTFDDGPHPINTPSVLDTLKEYKIKATFFVLGERVKANKASRELLLRMVEEGHRVGNHSYSHKQLTTLADQGVINEIELAERAIADYIEPDLIMRPPYGSRNSRVDKLIKSINYKIVLWNVDTEDWKKKPTEWIDYGVGQIKARNKSLVLMHDIHATTARGLPAFIDKIIEAGGSFSDLESVM